MLTATTPSRVAELYQIVAFMTEAEFAAALEEAGRVRLVRQAWVGMGFLTNSASKANILHYFRERRGGYIRSKLTMPAGRTITPLIDDE